MRYFRKSLSFIFVLALATIAQSQSTPQDQLDEININIRKERMRVERAKRLEKGILNAVSDYNASIAKLRREISKLNDSLKKIDEDIAASEAEREKLNKKINEQRVQLSARLRSMYKFGAPGLAELMLGAGSYSDLDRRHKYYEELAKLDRNLLESYRSNMEQLALLEAKLKEKRIKLKASRKEVAARQARMIDEREGKKKLLQDIQEQKELHLKALAELEAASNRLTGLISRVDKAKQQEEIRTKPVRTATKEADISNREVIPDTAEFPPAEEKGFELAKGKLCMPAAGNIIKTFGPKINPRFNTKTYHKGINIGAAQGYRIKAVYKGEVVFSGWLRGYGNLIILRHEGSYYTLYAHAGELYKMKGSQVQRGDVLGTVGETGSLEGPNLYFEVRHHEQPLNPSRWLNTACR